MQLQLSLCLAAGLGLLGATSASAQAPTNTLSTNFTLTIKSPKDGKTLKRPVGKGFNVNVRVSELVPRETYQFETAAVPLPLPTNGAVVTEWVAAKSHKANRKGFRNFVAKKVGQNLEAATEFELWSRVSQGDTLIPVTNRQGPFSYEPNGKK